MDEPESTNYSLHLLPQNETEDTPSTFDWATFVSYWELMVAIIGTPMNLFVIFIWFTLSSPNNRRLSTRFRNRWFILSMTCGDLLFTSVHSPMMFLWYGDKLEMTDFWCYVTYGFTHLSTTISSISLLLLNIDKFVYLHWPLHYPLMMTKRKVISLTAGAWIISMNWTLLFLFGPFMTRASSCAWKAQHREFYLSFLIIFFLMPIVLSTATSFYIASVAVRASWFESISDSIHTNGNSIDHRLSTNFDGDFSKLTEQRSNSTVSYSKAPWRTITFVFSTTIWSTLTYLPYRISFIVFTVTSRIVTSWHYPLFALMVVYAAGNPFITIFTQPQYRRRAYELIVTRVRRDRKYSMRDDM